VTLNKFDEKDQRKIISNFEVATKGKILSRIPSQFNYNKNNQGAFYYLGTYGYTRPFTNPSSSHLVRAFSSTLYSGRPSDILDQSPKATCTT